MPADLHTASVLADNPDDPDFALRFHLACRIFPPRTDPMTFDFCKDAVAAVKAGDPNKRINMRGVCVYRGHPTAPAYTIIANFNLHDFVA